jgi:hypothetical protein
MIQKIRMALIGLLLMAIVHPLCARQKFGVIKGILDVSHNALTPLSGATEKVRHQPFQLETWKNAHTGLEVYRGDNLLVKKHTRVEMIVQNTAESGRLIFLSESPAGLKDDAVYKIGDAASRTGGPELSIIYGTLVVDWVDGRFGVIACGFRTLFVEAKAVYVVEKNGDDGLLFLQKGRIVFPDYPEIKISSQQTVRLRRGYPPQIVTIGAVESGRLNCFADNTMNPFPSPKSGASILSKPAFYISAAALVTWIAYTIASSNIKGANNID